MKTNLLYREDHDSHDFVLTFNYVVYSCLVFGICRRHTIEGSIPMAKQKLKLLSGLNKFTLLILFKRNFMSVDQF